MVLNSLVMNVKKPGFDPENFRESLAESCSLGAFSLFSFRRVERSFKVLRQGRNALAPLFSEVFGVFGDEVGGDFGDLDRCEHLSPGLHLGSVVAR